MSQNRLRTFGADGRFRLGRRNGRTTDLRKTYMCSICLPQSGQALRPTFWFVTPFGETSRRLASKSLHSRCQSARRQPHTRRRNCHYEVLDGHMPEPARHLIKNGGARRDRTDDLKLAKLPLSQLSYGPVSTHLGSSPSGQPQSWWAWEDLNFRPHAYQARALTN